ncbi:MAG: hypothetical protein FWG36_05735 [Oscillospiraceae bacterium]|nr:hypothetical protein [Oscillospiraceae bacterium]
MKIETGESLIYSWLRHEKLCQIAQLNWKPSQYWNIDNYNDLQTLFEKFDLYYKDKYGYDIFKGCSLEQLLKQAEIDVVGIAFSESAQSIYAVDVAYHAAGMNYGDKDKTITKIIQKCIRTVLCLLGFFSMATGEIIFASPKINPSIEKELNPMLDELTNLVKNLGLEYSVLLYCNEAFFSDIMQPIIVKGTKIADTSELFLRSVQMYQMFAQSTKSSALAYGVRTEKPQRAMAKTNTVYGDGKAIDRIPKWAANPDQNNYRIIRAFFQLLNEYGRVNRPALEERCQSEQSHPDVYVKDFRGNFASMKTDKGNSHGKVFIDDGYNITIWDDVINVLEKYYNLFLG